jgi:twitching motility protein PilT
MASAMPIATEAVMAETLFSIDDLLEQMVARNASDLHITVGAHPVVRVRGRLEPLQDIAPLTGEMTQQLLYRILSTEQQKQLEIGRQIDLAHSIPGLARFRVNVYWQRETLGAAFRLIPTEIKTLEELGIPSSLHGLTDKPRGLVLVTGPTGSGKSTTLAALIDEINRKRAEHILTIEDPIEFVHRHKRCVVNQREIGVDATDFANALRAALRQDPDVILLGEMRDLETIGTALTAAETGHLVFATLHTQSAPGTIDRVIDAFPAAQQDQVRIQLAATLEGVVTQALLPTADGQGRVPALEILFPDDAVRNLIRQAKVEQVYSVMQTGTGKGMQTMEQSLADLTLRGVITMDTAIGRSSRPEQLFGLLERAGFDIAPDQAPAPSLRVAEG